MMKKILSITAVSAIMATGAFASQGANVSVYGGYIDYSGSSVLNSKKVAGITINKKINSNKLMMDLKYVYFDTTVVNPHKWDLSAEYSMNNLLPKYQVQIGGKLTELYYTGDSYSVYTVFGGINEKKPGLFAPLKIKSGLKVYYTDISDFIDDQKLTQVDFNLKKKYKGVLSGDLVLENTLTYQHFSEDNFEGRDSYVSDVVSAKLIKEKTIYMGHISLGHSSLKIEKDNKYAMDTSSNVHKWGLGGGVAYKLDKTSKIVAKVRYNRVKSAFGDGNANEMKYVIGYSLSF